MMGLTYLSNKICPRCGIGGYVWYLDNSKFVAKCINCGHYFRGEDFPMCVSDEASKPITNYDSIISKSTEDLAELLFDITNHACPPCRKFGAFCGKDPNCKACWLDWLRQEADNV